MKKLLLLTAVLLFGLTTCSDSDIPVTGVSLNYSSAALSAGETKRKEATVLPANASNQSVRWHSSNTAVATVSATGVVTALSTGSTTITVTTVCGAHTATSDITVVQPIPVTGVTLNRNTTTITIGNSETLTATLIPVDATNQNLTWTSSNPFVAYVDPQGRITTISVGETTITVTTDCGAHTATCVVTVAPIPVTGVTLDRNTATVFIGRTTPLLTVTVIPANATNRNVMWRSSNVAVATVDAYGRVTGVGAGTTIIRAITECGGRTASSTVTVGELNPADYVVINGVYWAIRNVGAPGTFVVNPQDTGMHYQWNRRTDDWTSDWTTAATTWALVNDPCPAGWRVPTYAELSSLNSAGSTWETNWNDTGVYGRVFGTAPNQIFLPAAGSRHSTGVAGVGIGGSYWGSTSSGALNAHRLSFGSLGSNMRRDFIFQDTGLSVRCVAK